ncbi:hypothetical protein HDU83_001384, partial [Entophlyctis luteolus]
MNTFPPGSDRLNFATSASSVLRSHVGDETDIRVIREATAALESVFPQSELSAFVSLSRADKEAQLNGLTQLVTGIRLFNKQLGKGGESVDD